MKKGGSLANFPALFTTKNHLLVLQKDILMIIFFSAMLNEIFHLDRDYPWPKPCCCPRCNSCRVWGHGFVTACFDGYNCPLPLRRYRCPDCKCILRLRPKGYFKRFQAPIATIRKSILSKARTGKWVDGIDRNRQGHWYRSLLKRIRAYLTDTWWQGLVAGFDYLLQLGQIPVCRSI